MIIHYHGSDIRGKWEPKKHEWKHADHIYYSTRDLAENAPQKAEYLPNPVDTKLFKPKKTENIQENSAITFKYNADDEAKKYARKHNLNLQILERDYPYNKMPEILSSAEYYLDFKKVEGSEDILSKNRYISKTGLEALATDTKVVLGDRSILDKLPKEHRAEYVATKVYTKYLELNKE